VFRVSGEGNWLRGLQQDPYRKCGHLGGMFPGEGLPRQTLALQLPVWSERYYSQPVSTVTCMGLFSAAAWGSCAPYPCEGLVWATLPLCQERIPIHTPNKVQGPCLTQIPRTELLLVFAFSCLSPSLLSRSLSLFSLCASLLLGPLGLGTVDKQ
jgi:hypothetical protein